MATALNLKAALFLALTVCNVAWASVVEPVSQKQKGSDFRGCFFANFAEVYKPGSNNATIENYSPGLCRHVYYCCNVVDYDSTSGQFSINPDAFGSQLPDFARLQTKDPSFKSVLSLTADNVWSLIATDATDGAAYRSKLISVVIGYLRRNNLGGVGINIGHADLSLAKNTYNAFINELRSAFDAESRDASRERLILTVSVSGYPEQAKAGYDAQSIGRVADYVLIDNYYFNYTQTNGVYTTDTTNQTYFISPQSSADDAQTYDDKYFNVEYAAKLWKELGVPKQKIVLKVLNYGRGWILDDNDTDSESQGTGSETTGPTPSTLSMRVPGLASYAEICSQVKSGEGSTYWNWAQRAPYAIVNDYWYCYDDSKSCANKAKLARQEGYGGVLATQLQLDDVTGACGQGTFPITKAMAN